MEHEHISTAYDVELDELKQSILDMGARWDDDRQLGQVACWQDTPLAERTIRTGQEINAAEVSSMSAGWKLLALPNLRPEICRFITLALKIVTNLERIGDKCANIAKRTRIGMKSHRSNPISIYPAGPLGEVMVKEALDAFVHGDSICR